MQERPNDQKINSAMNVYNMAEHAKYCINKYRNFMIIWELT